MGNNADFGIYVSFCGEILSNIRRIERGHTVPGKKATGGPTREKIHKRLHEGS